MAAATHQAAHDVGDDDLPGRGRGAQPRRFDDGRAEKIALCVASPQETPMRICRGAWRERRTAPSFACCMATAQAMASAANAACQRTGDSDPTPVSQRSGAGALSTCFGFQQPGGVVSSGAGTLA